MVGLLDLAPSTRTVRVGGNEVSVYGVSARGIAALLVQFPALKDAFIGGTLKFDPSTLTEIAPDAVSAIIAAGCGFPGDGEAIKAADMLPVGVQAELLDAIVELTMPDGIDPFVEALTSVMNRLSSAENGKAPVTKSE